MQLQRWNKCTLSHAYLIPNEKQEKQPQNNAAWLSRKSCCWCPHNRHEEEFQVCWSVVVLQCNGANNVWSFGARFCCRSKNPDWIRSQYSWEDGNSLELDRKMRIYMKGSISFPLLCSAAIEDPNATSTFFSCHSKIRPPKSHCWA